MSCWKLGRSFDTSLVLVNIGNRSKANLVGMEALLGVRHGVTSFLRRAMCHSPASAHASSPSPHASSAVLTRARQDARLGLHLPVCDERLWPAIPKQDPGTFPSFSLSVIMQEQSRAEQSRAEQSRAEQSRAEQSRALLPPTSSFIGGTISALGSSLHISF
jgi:hypothetical protein